MSLFIEKIVVSGLVIAWRFAQLAWRVEFAGPELELLQRLQPDGCLEHQHRLSTDPNEYMY